jgi:hypothetical protein
MQVEKDLIKSKFIPIAKYWSLRLGFLDIINNTRLFISQIEDRKDIGDDIRVMTQVSKDWKTKDEINVGEAGFLFRLLQFASWKFGLGKRFIKEKTLESRKICDNPEIINWPIGELLKLDDNTTQWASASILTSPTPEVGEIPDNYFLNLSREALAHYEKVCKEGGVCEVRHDDTILKQANAFIDFLKNGKMDFSPVQPDDYCFARAFGLISYEEGEKMWPELKSHESNRLEEMEKQLVNLEIDKDIDSHDHRVVQAIAMLAFSQKKKAEFAHPECVSKSWPQFWRIMESLQSS